jgi:hypothetical protein
MTHRIITPIGGASRATQMRSKSKPGQLIGKRIAEVCKNLKPFQSLEFDPNRGLVTIVTELIVPSNDPAQIADILAQRMSGEKILVRRFADSYKITLSRSIKL